MRIPGFDRFPRLVQVLTPFTVVLMLFTFVACGGGSSSSDRDANSSETRATPSSTSSSSLTRIRLWGNITYDRVPHSRSHQGLDYALTQVLPGRGLVVELLDADGQVLARTLSDDQGVYEFDVAAHRQVRVRVKAQIRENPHGDATQWDFRVTDNTENNRPYAMVGALGAADEGSARRDLHAASGWTGKAYTEPRVAAPFAIIDTVYQGVQRLRAADNQLVFPPLELRWSSRNNTAVGDWSRGEISTSFYREDMEAIYILGNENDDTDEYDRHVILHEWAHYIEATLSRSDSIGGDHHTEDMLDMRVAMSEGFSNAFSAMLLDDPIYRDTSGAYQGTGFQITVNRLSNAVRGWFSEASVQAILYHLYLSEQNKSSRDLSDILNVLKAPAFIDSDALVTIYLFAEQLRETFPRYTAVLDALLLGQQIAITDRFGREESNSGGYARHLPVYKTLSSDAGPVKVCTSNELGMHNKTGNAQFLRWDLTSAGLYRLQADEVAPLSRKTAPILSLYHRGALIKVSADDYENSARLDIALREGVYIVEIVDAALNRPDTAVSAQRCFDVRAVPLNEVIL